MTPSSGPRREILLIEDHEDTAASLAELLRLDGHEVEVAAEGRAGVRLAVAHAYDVVLCDLALPDLDGYQVADEIRKARPGAVLVAFSGYGGTETVARAEAAGFSRHILKPASYEQVQRILDEL